MSYILRGKVILLDMAPHSRLVISLSSVYNTLANGFTKRQLHSLSERELNERAIIEFMRGNYKPF